MFKRPRRGDDENDILRMQEEFLREKRKNENFQPAAQIVNLRPAKLSQSVTKTNSTKMCSNSNKMSKYAQLKSLKRHANNKDGKGDIYGPVMGDIVEKNLSGPSEEHLRDVEDDKVYYPQIIPSVLGKVIEKNFENPVEFNFACMPSQGFPVVTKRNSNTNNFNFGPYHSGRPIEMDVDRPTSSISIKTLSESSLNLPTKSYLLSSSEADAIHNDNVKTLSKLSEKEILEEQQKLMTSLDPKVIAFLKSQRKLEKSEPVLTSSTSRVKVLQDIMNKKDEVQDIATAEDTLWENDILSHPNIGQWLHFNSLEKDKLEWMKGIDENAKINPDEPYEARFDFKGYLLPFTVEYTEKTKTLFHHGEESHRPGYSLSELFDLTRSTILQQRATALNTIAGILEYYSLGTYKGVLDIPISKIFFLVRIAMDENKIIILESALKAMRNLLYNRIDEACLDALLGFEEGSYQPCLQNDKSEIEELESKESDLQDFHLAEIDIITTLLRTDIIQRFYYILEIVKPNFNCVHYILQILTRLARDSVETAISIVKTEHLMNTIIKHFVPKTAINFHFEPNILYNGKPILTALKLLRVLSLQTKEIDEILITKYNILNPISEYINSGIDGTYGLRIQIESFCILTNVLHYGLGAEIASSLSPVIVSTLHKHVKGTDIYVNSSVLSVTHAAIVVQTISKVLSYKSDDFITFKHQVYPLLVEGTQKWLMQLAQSDNYTCGHLRLLCSILDFCRTMLLIEKITFQSLNDTLMLLSSSQGFKMLLKHIIPSSNLLSDIEVKNLHFTKNIMSLNCTLVDSPQKVLPIFNVSSPMPFLTSLYKLLEVINDNKLSLVYVENFEKYIEKLASAVPSLCDNWFTRLETDLVFSIVKLSLLCTTIPESKKDELYAVANKLCYILRIDKIYELDFLFSNVVFSKKWFTTDRLMNLVSISDTGGFSKVLSSIDDIRVCYSKVINLKYAETGPNIVLRLWKEPILPRDWIYLPILNLYSKSQTISNTPRVVGELANKVAAQFAAEKEFILTCSLEWILFNELCFPELLNDIDITDRLCRIMCVFLCDNSLFLDTKIKPSLEKCLQALYKMEKKKPFNFDKSLTGLSNFQDFYTQFLEQFQSVSYGDATFAACVLVPLAQRHNVKWRKLLWSEYAGCLRALDCPENLLCYEMQDYLYPEETDESLIKSYFHALSSNLLRPNTVTYRIADHHAKNFKTRLNMVET